MKILSACKTDIGLVSNHNEDYVWTDPNQHIYIVADGLGGHEAGEVASRLAATTIGKVVSSALKNDLLNKAEVTQTLLTAVEEANQAVWTASNGANQNRRMGCTIVIAVICPPVAYIAHAGDARAYLIRNLALTRLTADDSWVAHLVAAGVLSEEEAKHNRLSHVITKAVGQESPVEATIAEIPVQPGDWLILCSDGLWNMVEDDEILAQVNRAGNNPENLADHLVQAANNAGGKDNISVIALKIA